MNKTLRIGMVVSGLLLSLGLPWAPFIPYSVLGRLNQAAVLTLVAASLVLLTGWAGQISLGHAALVGVGAYATGWFTAGLRVPFPLNILLSAAAAGIFAALLGAVAVRIRGLYLAVATLIFSWMADAFLFRLDLFTKYGTIGSQRTASPNTIPSFDLTDRRYFYYIAWTLALAGLCAVANIRDSKTGRAFLAIKGSEVAAASLGINVVRYKLLAFVISGTMAGAAGALVLINSLSVIPTQFGFSFSLLYLSILVVGGLVSLPGAVASSFVFSGLEELFYRLKALEGFLEVASACLLVIALRATPGGLGEALMVAKRSFKRRLSFPRLSQSKDNMNVPTRRRALPASSQPPTQSEIHARSERALAVVARNSRWYFRRGSTNTSKKQSRIDKVSARRQRMLGWWRRVSKEAFRGKDQEIHSLIKLGRDAPREALACIETRNITVEFGGLVAIKDVSLEVPQGKIIGLIGPNGAGKTTLFNTISGLVAPSSGEVQLHGRNVTKKPVHSRAIMGLARTFQVIQLFPQSSVFENLLVARHGKDRTGIFSHLFVSNEALQNDHLNRDQVGEVVKKLGLEDVADQRVADLPFGTLRLVEIGRALVTGAPVIMLDEPASGLDERETDRLIEILVAIRETGTAVLLIEHDVRMVVAVSDYMYVLDQGKVIAQGTPRQIQSDPVVIAAYLGEPIKKETS